MFRPRRLHRLTANFDLVTPAFCGGADPDDGLAGLRLPSLLGALRFWWRALAWSRADGHDEADRLRTVAGWEQQLFGSARTGQGSFVARLRDDRTAACTDPRDRAGGYPHASFGRPQWQPSSGITYLAGQGLTRRSDGANRDQRSSLKSGGGFSLSLTSRKPFADGAATEGCPSVVEALRLLGLIGGVGARARRGFGSLRLKAIAIDDGSGNPPTLEAPPADPAAYHTAIETILGSLSDNSDDIENIPYTALSGDSRAWLIKASDGVSVSELHDEMGYRLLYYRGTGYLAHGKRKVAGVEKPPARHRFEGDHQWFIRAREASNPRQIAGVPERSIFGLPHNYFKPPNHAGLQVDIAPEEHDRRASPLFLHIHHFDQSPPVALWLFLPSRFLPSANSRLKVESKRNGVDADISFLPNWQPIEGFFDDGHLPGAEEIPRVAAR